MAAWPAVGADGGLVTWPGVLRSQFKLEGHVPSCRVPATLPRGGGFPLSHRPASQERLPPRGAARGGTGGHPALLYRVQSGDTLWSIAVEHGVSVRDICAANGWAGQGPTIYEGQRVRLPPHARLRPGAAPGCPAPSGPAASRDDVPDLWEGPGTFVRALSAAEVEDLTRASAYRPAAHDTLLVVYAPWCPWCKDMEAAFEATARTLSNDPDVVVAKLRGDLPGTRSFAYSALGARTFPTILAMSRVNGRPVKHEGARDATSLLNFFDEVVGSRAEGKVAETRGGWDGEEGAAASGAECGTAEGDGEATEGAQEATGIVAAPAGPRLALPRLPSLPKFALSRPQLPSLAPPPGEAAVVHWLGVAALLVVSGVVLRGSLSAAALALTEFRGAAEDCVAEGTPAARALRAAWARVGKRSAARSAGAEALGAAGKDADGMTWELLVGLSRVGMSRMVILASQIADLGHLLAVSIFQFLRASAITVPQAAWLLLLVTKHATLAFLRLAAAVLWGVAGFMARLLRAVLFLLGAADSVGASSDSDGASSERPKYAPDSGVPGR